MKKNLASRWIWTLACGVVGLWVQIAHAGEPRLLLVEPPGPPGGLLVALQIQLIGLAEPERVVQPLAASAPEQISAGSALARSRGALASVWVDPPLSRPAGVVMLYVVGERQGRALVEVVRVQGERGPALDRTLALKVREVVAELRRAAASSPAAAQLQAPAPPPPAADAEPDAEPPQPSAAPQPAAAAAEPPQPSAARWSGFLLLGPRLGSQPLLGLARWGVGVGAGPALTLREWRLSVVLNADWFPVRHAEVEGNSVRYWELDAAFALQAEHSFGPLWLGARIGPQLIYLDASGTTVNGLTGPPYSGTIWGLAFGVDAEWSLTRALALAADLQLQSLASHESFSVNGHELVDAGRLRARLGLSLVYRP